MWTSKNEDEEQYDTGLFNLRSGRAEEENKNK
jgi:hypothetical protein